MSEDRDPPASMPEEGVLLGYSLEHEHRTAPIGFVYGTEDPAPSERSTDSPTLDPILHTGGGHLMTIAPTGSGKGVGCIIPTLLRYPGPVIVIDPKGENYAVTAERRRALGQKVVVLDPIGITEAPEVGALNPLDLIDSSSPQAIDDSAALASLLSGGVEKEDPRNLFWYQRGAQLLTGLIQFVAVERPVEKRNLAEVRRILNLPTEEFSQIAAAQMANSRDPDVRQVAGTLANPAAEMIGSILGMSQNSLGFLRGQLLTESTSESTFSLDAVTAGEPLSIYLVIPPDKLQSHRNLLRLWIGSLMAALMRRRMPVPHSTLLVLDEAAQLGPLEQLRQAITLMRGYGLQTWSFWQDVSQLENLYPLDWQTMYNNCHVHQAFGFTTLKSAETTCDLLGFHDPLDALQLDSDEIILSVSGDESVIAQKPNYLTDPAFRGLFSPNPFYTGAARPPSAQRKRRVYIRPTHPRPGESTTGSGQVEQRHTPRSGSDDGPPEEEAGDDDRLIDFDDLIESMGLDHLEDLEEASESAPEPSLLDPLPAIIVDYPRGVPTFLNLVIDEMGGTWNVVTTELRGITVPGFDDTYVVELLDPTNTPRRQLVLKTESSVRAFTGSATQFSELHRDTPIALNDQSVCEYVRVRTHFQRGTRRLRIVDTEDRLRFFADQTTEEALAEMVVLIEPMRSEARVGGGWTVTAIAVSEFQLMKVRVSVGIDGTILGDERESLVGVGDSAHYPSIGLDGVALDEAVTEQLERVHGRWEVLSGATLEAIRDDFGGYPLSRAGADPVIVRRTLSCYPGWDVYRFPNTEQPDREVYLRRPGKAFRAIRGAAGTLIRFTMSGLELRSAPQAEEYLRFYSWLISTAESYWLILDDPNGVPRARDPGQEETPTGSGIAGWKPVECLEVDEDADLSKSWRLRATFLRDGRIVIATATIQGDGEVELMESEDLGSAPEVDDDLLGRLLKLPPVGQSKVRTPHNAQEIAADAGPIE